MAREWKKGGKSGLRLHGTAASSLAEARQWTLFTSMLRASGVELCRPELNG